MRYIPRDNVGISSLDWKKYTFTYIYIALDREVWDIVDISFVTQPMRTATWLRRGTRLITDEVKPY